MSEDKKENSKVIELKIDKIVAGGKGLGRYQNKVYFVKYTAPNEVVRAKVLKEKRDFGEAKLLEVIIPSSQRTEPLCPHFGVCGGCQLQHLEYSSQLEQKVEIFKEQLTRIGKIKEIPPVEAISSPQPYGYRIRVRFHLQGGKLGFVEDETVAQEGERKLIDIDTCPVLHPKLNELIPVLKKVSASFKHLKEAQVTYSPSRDEALVKLISEKRISKEELKKIKEEFMPPWVVGIGSYRRVGRELIRLDFAGRDYTFITAGGFTYRVTAESFVQNNYLLWEEFIRLVTPQEKRGYCLDTFCGIGFFTIPFSKKAFFVEGSDMNNFAIADAEYNARINGSPNTLFTRATPSMHMKKHLDKEIDTVIFDPPRSGLDKRDLQILKELKPDRIIYVSCNPSTLARDLAKILSWGDYTYEKAYVIDLFPQTAHIESVNFLKKTGEEEND
ncbi:MAG: RNA methyltransferase [Aquificaceae bacterium]|nr:MAG: RNA methyltransferase [Aquificaceae bacterium]